MKRLFFIATVLLTVASISATAAEKSAGVEVKFKGNATLVAIGDESAFLRQFNETRKTAQSSPREATYVNYSSMEYYQMAVLPDGDTVTTITPFEYNTKLTIARSEKFLGYDCKVATTSVNSNSIEIWYTESIGFKGTPMPAWGVPNGLVLKVVRNGGSYFEAESITALYHNWIHPNILSDVNGEYPEMQSGRTVKMDSGVEKLSMFSGWDVYRISPFLASIFYPERQNLMVKSMMQMYRQSGSLPKFEIAGQDFMVMEGDAALPYLTACYFLGLTRGIDTEDLYQAMLKNAMGESYVRGKQDFYNENYYMPLRAKYDNSVSQALEYYIADWSLAQFAKSLGKTADAQMLEKRAMGYKRYFDPEYALLRPVLENGKFMEGFNPREGENFAPVNGFHEGTSWNYSFAIPYDVRGLIKMFGSERRFVDSLQTCFTEGYFDMGNEPDMNYPYLFNYVKGAEWRTQFWVNECLSKYFGNRPGGLPGNDDAGTMSAWQNLSMMGIYPPCPGNPEYTFTTPVFDKVTINLDTTYYKNDRLVIEAVNRTPENIYIDKIEVAGRHYRNYFISHTALMNAGSVKIYCTNKPKQ